MLILRRSILFDRLGMDCLLEILLTLLQRLGFDFFEDPPEERELKEGECQ